MQPMRCEAVVQESLIKPITVGERPYELDSAMWRSCLEMLNAAKRIDRETYLDRAAVLALGEVEVGRGTIWTAQGFLLGSSPRAVSAVPRAFFVGAWPV